MITRRATTFYFWTLIAVFIIVQSVVIRFFVMRGFSRIEQNELVRDMSRFTSQITLMQDNLLMSTRDWASWDDMYTFVVDSNPAFAAKNLPDDVIKYLKLNYVLLVDKKNSLKYSTAFDLCSGVRGALPGAMAAVGAWASGRLGAAGDGRKRCGLFMVDSVAVLVAWAPVLPSDERGESRGMLVFGQILTKPVVRGMEIAAAINAEVFRFGHVAVPVSYAEKIKRGFGSDSVFCMPTKKDSIAAITTLRDAMGTPILVIKVTSPRTIFQYGWLIVTITEGSAGAVVILLGLLLHGLLGLARRAEDRLKNTEAALVRAEKLESLGILAGGVAHDFNNLLTGIYGFLNCAFAKVRGGADAAVDLSQAMGTLDRARHLTTQLLTFAKGGVPVRKPMDIGKLLEDTLPFVLSGSSVVYELSLPPDLWPCNGDENLLAQVIDNVVINARQSMPGGGKVWISAQNIAPGAGVAQPLRPGAYVKITVRDEGSGIKPEHLAKVFDPFFTTKEKGSGLGLATAHSIMAKHCGHISVESIVGKGATVTLFVQALPGAVVKAKLESPPAAAARGSVLVVDDEPIIRQSCENLLKHMGYTAFAAADNGEARRIVTRRKEAGMPVAVVLCDLTIKNSSGGVAILADLRTIDPAIVGIVSSGYADDPVVAEPQRYGFQGVLRKPYSYEEFAKALGAAFELHGRRAG
jgi:signal transduction histidine kinase/ActR/RegA family two-component response regulator